MKTAHRKVTRSRRDIDGDAVRMKIRVAEHATVAVLCRPALAMLEEGYGNRDLLDIDAVASAPGPRGFAFQHCKGRAGCAVLSIFDQAFCIGRRKGDRARRASQPAVRAKGINPSRSSARTADRAGVRRRIAREHHRRLSRCRRVRLFGDEGRAVRP